MADTTRETTIPHHAEWLKSLQIFGERPNHNTSNRLNRQDVGSIASARLEGMVPILLQAARITATLHGQRLGATVSLRLGDMLGLPLYAVSLHPERTVEMRINPGWEHLFAFAVINSDLLFLPDYAIGTWFDSDRMLHVLDGVVCLSSVAEAIHLGVLHGQKAIFDLQVGREISLISNSVSKLGGSRK